MRKKVSFWRKPPFRWLNQAAALAAVALAVLFGADFLPIRYLENWVSDTRIALLNPKAPIHPDVVVVEITEATFAELGRRSPVDRGFLSRILRDLDSAGAKVIGLDILFDQPSEAAKDEMLIETLNGLSVPAVLAWADVATSHGFMQPWQERNLRRFGERIDNPRIVFGAANLRVDEDGTVRKMFTGVENGAAPPAFSLAIARLLGHGGISPDVRLAYYGRQWRARLPFNTIPAHSIDRSNAATWAVMKRAFQGKAVLIGANLPGIDRYRTPFAADPLRGERSSAGVFLHAHALAQLIDGRQLPKAPTWISWLTVAVLLGGGFAFGTADTTAARRALGSLAAVLAFWASTVLIFVYGGRAGVPLSTGPLVPVVAPTLGFLVALGIGVGAARRRHLEEKRFIRKVLRHYVPPTVMNELIADPSRLCLGGERREMTFVFTDIAGFTGLCELIDPGVLVATLNEYLDGMCNLIHEYQGTIDKFVGDAVVAFWGAPADKPDQADLAVRCALAMDDFAVAFAADKSRDGVNLGLTRIGVHTGIATVGNFGGNIRYDYTALGDAVNIAARLENVNKYIGTRICVGGPTRERCSGIAFRPVGEFVLKGKQKSVAVFEPTNDGASATARAYLAAFELMRSGRWDEAETALDSLLTAAPGEGVAKFHLSRLRRGEYSLEIVMEEK